MPVKEFQIPHTQGSLPNLYLKIRSRQKQKGFRVRAFLHAFAFLSSKDLRIFGGDSVSEAHSSHRITFLEDRCEVAITAANPILQ